MDFERKRSNFGQAQSHGWTDRGGVTDEKWQTVGIWSTGCGFELVIFVGIWDLNICRVSHHFPEIGFKLYINLSSRRRGSDNLNNL